MSDENNGLEMELHNLAKIFKDDPVNLEKAIKELADKTPLDITINFMKEKSKTANLLVNTSDPDDVSDDLTPLVLSEIPSQKQIQAPPPAEPEFTKEEQAKFAEMENNRIAAEEEAALRNPVTGGGKKRRKTKKKKKSKKRKTKRRYKTGKRN